MGKYMNIALFKRLVRWFWFLAIMHIAAILVFNPWIATMLYNVYERVPMRMLTGTFMFDCVITVAFLLIYFKIQTSDAEFKRNLKDNIKAPDFSLVKFYKDNQLTEPLYKIGIDAFFHIPYAIYYGVMSYILPSDIPFREYFHMTLKSPIGFQQFYTIDTGSYLLTNSPFFGFLLCTVLFGVLFLVTHFLNLFFLKNDIIKNVIVK